MGFGAMSRKNSVKSACADSGSMSGDWANRTMRIGVIKRLQRVARGMCRQEIALSGGFMRGMRLQRRFAGRRGSSVAFSCFAVSAIALMAASPVKAETLIEALAQAYRYNPQIDSQRAQLRATDENVSQANAGYRPDIRASASVTYDNTTTRASGIGRSTVDETPKSYAVQLVQPIFQGFQVVNSVNAAEANVRAGREELRNVEQTVLLEAVTAYENVVRDQAVVRLTENNLGFLNAELRATKDRFSVGEVTKTDVAQAEARKALGQSDLDVARATLKASRATYEQVIGTPPQNLREPSPSIPQLPRNLNDAISVSTQENPQVVNALYLEQAARFTVDQINGELLPQAQFEATWQEQYDTSSTVHETESATFVGRVNVPIFADGGAVYSRVRQAKHVHVSALQNIETARAGAQSQAAQAWAQLQGFRAQRLSAEAQIAANKTALEGVQEEEKVGQRTLLDVLNAQQELLSSQVSLETTKRDVIVASYTVLAAMGRLNVAELGAVDSAYDPEVHYQEVRNKWFGLDITHDDGRQERLEAQPRVEVERLK